MVFTDWLANIRRQLFPSAGSQPRRRPRALGACVPAMVEVLEPRRMLSATAPEITSANYVPPSATDPQAKITGDYTGDNCAFIEHDNSIATAC